MTITDEPVRLDVEEATAPDIRYSMQLAGLADSGSPEDAPPARPQILFILAPDETFEVDPPDDVLRLHEIQAGKRNSHGRRPTLFRDSRFRSPNPIPSRVAIASATICALLFGNQSVSLCAQGINLEYVGVAAIVSRVDEDFEIVIQLLADVAPQLGGDDRLGIGIEAGDAEIHFVLCVEDTDFRFFSRRLPFIGLSL